MKALVTGSAGFVGRHMVRELEARGWDVDGWDLIDGRDVRWLFTDGVHDQVYDLVVHLAFHVGGRTAIDGEPRLLAKNLELDSAMFDWAVRTGQRRVLYFSSSAAYPVGYQTGNAPYRLHENDMWLDQKVSSALIEAMGYMAPLLPDARYGWAKLTGEQLARAASEAGLPVHVVRPFSGYGEDQSLDYPFPSFIARAKAQVDPFEIWGTGEQVRDWIHISDVVAGALAVVDEDVRDPVNLCTGRGTSMLQVAQMAAAAVRTEARPAMLTMAEIGEAATALHHHSRILRPGMTYQPSFKTLPARPAGVMYRVGDPTRSHEIYQPKVSLEEGIRRALAA